MRDSARDQILSRIRKSTSGEKTPLKRAVTEIQRRPRQQVIDQFITYVREYEATVLVCSLEGIPSAVNEWITENLRESVVTPADLPMEWLPADLPFTPAPDLSDLYKATAVITGCALGIAETGTIALDCGFAQGLRRLTLVPDFHVCIIFQEQIVDTVTESIHCSPKASQTTVP